MIESIDSVDMPGYFLNDFKQAAAIIEEVGARNPSLQYDAYHAWIITGDVMAVWQQQRHLVRHIQIAGVPGRDQLRGGEIDSSAFFS